MRIPNPTSPNPALDKLANKTFDGMAHWAGTGPPDATCGKCTFWGPQGEGSKLKLLRCAKFTQLTGQVGPSPIPGGTAACRHFEKAKAKL